MVWGFQEVWVWLWFNSGTFSSPSTDPDHCWLITDRFWWLTSVSRRGRRGRNRGVQRFYGWEKSEKKMKNNFKISVCASTDTCSLHGTVFSWRRSIWRNVTQCLIRLSRRQSDYPGEDKGITAASNEDIIWREAKLKTSFPRYQLGYL